MEDEPVLNGPETVGEHQGVWQQKEDHDPEERWHGDQRFVVAGVHVGCRIRSGDLFLHADGVDGIESKIVLTGELTACGYACAQRLCAGAVKFEQFAKPAVDLLADLAAEANQILAGDVRGETDRFGPERVEGGTVGDITGTVCGPAKRAAGGNAIANLGEEQVCLTDELSGVGGGGMSVDFAGSCDLFESAIAEKSDAIGESHGFFLVVGDKEKGDSDFA